ncbi:STAS domain-containing protein [Singulisphaera rosea]
MIETTSPQLLVETVQGVMIASFTNTQLVSEEVLFEVESELIGLVDGSRPSSVLLNFREVRSMSSTMLAVLLKVSRRVSGIGGRLKICGLSPDLEPIFRITRFDRLFEVYPEEYLALDAF